jgi:hypothetical protein
LLISTHCTWHWICKMWVHGENWQTHGRNDSNPNTLTKRDVYYVLHLLLHLLCHLLFLFTLHFSLTFSYFYSFILWYFKMVFLTTNALFLSFVLLYICYFFKLIYLHNFAQGISLSYFHISLQGNFIKIIPSITLLNLFLPYLK